MVFLKCVIRKTIETTLLCDNNENNEKFGTPKFFMPYEKGISEQRNFVAPRYDLELIFTRTLSLKLK